MTEHFNEIEGERFVEMALQQGLLQELSLIHI